MPLMLGCAFIEDNNVNTITMDQEVTLSKEALAAVFHALHLEIDRTRHDQESYKLTIKQPKFSTWSLKFQEMRQLPERRFNIKQ